MPSRIIREGINSSPRVNQLSFGAEILYRRLMSVVDDYGRYYASPAAVRGGCWPTNPSPPCEQNVRNWIAECAQGDRPLLRVYEVDGCRYLELSDFNQKIRSKSKFPEPADILPAECQQVADETPALDVFRISNCEVRNAKTETVPPAPPQPEQRRPVLVPDSSGVDEWFEERLQKHPNKRNIILAKRNLCDLREALNPEWRKEFARVHDLWCATEGWRWKGGAKCPTMAEWIVDKGWRYPPPQESAPAPQPTALQIALQRAKEKENADNSLCG